MPAGDVRGLPIGDNEFCVIAEPAHFSLCRQIVVDLRNRQTGEVFQDVNKLGPIRDGGQHEVRFKVFRGLTNLDMNAPWINLIKGRLDDYVKHMAILQSGKKKIRKGLRSRSLWQTRNNDE